MREVSDEEVLDIMAIAKMHGVWTDNGNEYLWGKCFKDTKEKLMRGWTIDWDKERWIKPWEKNDGRRSK